MEPLALGLSSGLVCVVSCGPVVLPWLTAERRPWRGTTALLAAFLGGRLAGYLGFAVIAWSVGVALSGTGRAGAAVFALAHLALAVMLLVYVAPRRGTPAGGCAVRGGAPAAGRIRGEDTSLPVVHGLTTGTRRRAMGAGFPSAARLARAAGRLAPAALGLFTGLTPCPPFLAAGIRAAERDTLAGSLAFFVLFFAGTTLWFAPFTAVALLRRVAPLATVARLTTVPVAVYYGYLGTVALGGAILHG